MNSFTRSIELLQKALDVNSLRYQVTANNMANSEVPNFKRSVVNFESELKRAFDSEKERGDPLLGTGTCGNGALESAAGAAAGDDRGEDHGGLPGVDRQPDRTLRVPCS